MRIIWKYQLDESIKTLQIPKDYKVLSVINQGNIPTLYCLVNPENELVENEFVTVGTGTPVDNWIEHLKFIGTVITNDEMIVLHIFKA